VSSSGVDGGAVSERGAQFGLWLLSPDPRHADIAMRVVEGTGTPLRILNALPGPDDDDGGIRPGWFLIDLSARGVDASTLETFKATHRDCQLFLISSDAKGPAPADLGRLGVRHWFVPPLDAGELKRVFRAALRTRRAELARARTRKIEFPGFSALIGRSAAFLETCELARRAAASPSTVVLIEGETGTGKGLFALGIHRESPRSAGPFVDVNCASLPGQLLESELFGHEQGAFTHAQNAKQGLLELADSGTFFLDEVAETDPQVQAKILKFLDSGRYRRVGGTEEREVDVRVLAATQKDLDLEARSGRFRLDLFHRLHVIRLRIPPVRERPGDIRLLLEHYLREFARRQGKGEMRWSGATLTLLEKQPWPGNVREIVNFCERIVLMSPNATVITPEDLPERAMVDRVLRGVRSDAGSRLRLDVPDGIHLAEIERAAIESALEKSRGNVSAAAGSLGIGRGQLRYKMEKLGVGDEAIGTPVGRRRSARRRTRAA
jgi:two-component system, NtrC family, response regulator AtoC